MERRNKIIMYSLLLTLGVAVFVTEFFILQKPDGTAGLIICISSILLSIGSIIKLCSLSEKVSGWFSNLLDVLFSLPFDGNFS